MRKAPVLAELAAAVGRTWNRTWTRSAMRTAPRTAGALVAAVLLAACADDPASPALGEPSANFDRARSGEGYARRGELRTGFIFGRDREPMAVTYEVQGELAVWQGDIVIGRARDIPRTRAQLLAGKPTGFSAAVYIANTASDDFRWTGGVVPYVIDANLTNQARVTDAIAIITEKTAGITFVERSGEANFLNFVTAGGCSSSIGRVGGGQNINLDTDCGLGNTVHEIIHALGVFHEQSRCDRDGFVEVFIGNVEDGKTHNFDKECVGAFDHGDYDEGSIMHYGTHFFSKNGEATLNSLRGRNADMGQRDSIGPTDIVTLNFLYGANNVGPAAVIAALAAQYVEGSSVSFDGSGSSDPDDPVLTYQWDFGDGSCAVTPQPAECTVAAPNHVYTQNGSYSVTLTVSDGTLSDVAEATVTVVNAAPQVFAGDDASRNEGALFERAGSFTDPGADTWTATVDYGDGAGVQALDLVGKTFLLSHAYADNGSYTITVRVTDSDDGTGTDGVDMTIDNVIPTVMAGADGSVVSGSDYTLTGNFSDPGVIDHPWTWSVNWGFGINSTGSTNDQSATISATKQACAAGTFNVVLAVTDKDGGKGTDALTLTVSHFAVQIDITPTQSPNPIRLGRSGLVPVGLLSTATFDATSADFSKITLGNEVGTDTPVARQGKGTYHAKLEDVNRDGRMDVVLMFDARALTTNGDIAVGTIQLVLRGFLSDGCTNFRGTDAVVIVP